MPEGNNIDHLQIEIETSGASAAKGLNELATALGRLNTVKGNINKNFFADLADGLKPLSGLKFTGLGSALGEIRKLPQALEGLKSVNLNDYVGKIQELVNVLEPLAVRSREIAAAFQNVAKTTIKVNVKEGEVAKAKEATANYSNLLGVMKKLAAPVKKAAAAFGGLLKNIGSHIVNAFTSKLRGIINGVQRLYHSIQRVVLMRAIRAALRQITAGFKEGIDNLYQWSAAVDGRFKGSMDKLATSMLYLKNSIAAMVSPIINKLAPAIDYLVDRFVDLLNIVNQVFAALTGNNTWTRAVKYPVEYAESVADAAKDTADGYKEAAKELKLFLLPFDELNTLTKDKEAGTSASPSSGKGGGGGLNYAEMFETRELEDWAKKIKDLIDQGDWYGAGQALATHLNELVEQWDAHVFGTKVAEKLNEGIRFGLGFMRTFGWEELGGKFGGLLNGFAETFSWEEFGALLGTKVNAVSGFLKGFFKQFNGSTFGKGLGKLFNGWVKEIKVKDITDAFELGVEDATQIIISFFETVDYELLAQQIADLLTGCDWENIMSQVWEVAKAAIGATWKLGSALVDNLWNGYETDENGNKVSNPQKAKYGKGIVIGGATLGASAVGLSALGGLLKAVPGIAKIVQLFSGNGALSGILSALGPAKGAVVGKGTILAQSLLGKGGLAGLGSLLLPALPYIGTAAGAGIFAAGQADAVKNGTGVGNSLARIWGGAAAGASAGSAAGPFGALIGAGVGLTAGIETTAITAAVQFVTKNWDKIKEAAQPVIDWISQAWTDTCDWISEKWGLVSDWFSEKWSAISEWVDTNVIQPVKRVVEPVAEWIGKLFEGAWIIVKATWIIVSEWFDAHVIQPIVKLYNNVKEKIVNFLTEAWTRVKAIWTVVSGWFDSKVIQPVVKLYNKVKEKIVGYLTEAWDNVKTVWKVVSTWFENNIISPLINAFNSVTTFIKSAFRTAFNFVKRIAGSVINGVLAAIEGGINNAISGLNWLIGIFNQVVQAAAILTGDNWSGLSEIGYVNLGRVDVGGEDYSDAYESASGSRSAYDGLSESLKNALFGGAGNSTNTVNVNVELDGERVGRSVVNYVNQRTIADGMSPMYG